MSPEPPGRRERENELTSGIVVSRLWLVNIVFDPDKLVTHGLVEVVRVPGAIRPLISESLVVPILRESQLFLHDPRPDHGMWFMAVHISTSERDNQLPDRRLSSNTGFAHSKGYARRLVVRR